jgi:hypothetical protein
VDGSTVGDGDGDGELGLGLTSGWAADVEAGTSRAATSSAT